MRRRDDRWRGDPVGCGCSVLVAASLLALGGCAGVRAWLDEPVDDPGRVEVPVGGEGGGSVVVEGPTAEPEPVTVEGPGGSTVTVAPPQLPETRGGALARIAGGIVGAVLGNPGAGIAVAGLASLLLGRRRPPTA